MRGLFVGFLFSHKPCLTLKNSCEWKTSAEETKWMRAHANPAATGLRPVKAAVPDPERRSWAAC